MAEYECMRCTYIFLYIDHISIIARAMNINILKKKKINFLLRVANLTESMDSFSFKQTF